jgi:hypothetical protein
MLRPPSSDVQTEGALGGGDFGAVVAARKQVSVTVGGHRQRGVAEPRLHFFQRQFEATVLSAVDQPLA